MLAGGQAPTNFNLPQALPTKAGKMKVSKGHLILLTNTLSPS